MNQNIKEVKEYPTVINNVHESLYKSYQVLEMVKLMVNRKDSVETIKEIIDYLYEQD